MKNILKGTIRNAAWRLRKRKPVILALCILFALTLTLGITLAWFTSADSLVNRIIRGDLGGSFAITVVDKFTPPTDPPGAGESFVKHVGAKNEGTLPGFVRLLVLPVFVSEDGTLLPAEFGVHVIIKDWNTTDLDPENDWIDGGDGYFYYKHKLSPNENTDELGTNLFENVSLPETIPEGYENATLKIEVKCEAVGIDKWDYRMGWWGDADEPDDATLKTIDGILALLAQ